MPDTVIVITMKKRPIAVGKPTSSNSNSGFNRNDGTSSEEESDGEEIVIRKPSKSFGIRVAQTPQQAAQQVLSQIGNMADQRQANEVVVQQTESHEKTEAEKRALEQHQKLLEAQQLAKAQQAAALQAAAARVAQAQGQAQNHQAAAQEQARAQQEAALRAAQEQAKKAQQEALARAQKAQEEAVARAKAAQEAQQKAQKEALLRAQEAQKKAQEEAKARALQAQQAAQKAQSAQKPAQNGSVVQNAPKPAPQPQKQPAPVQNAPRPAQNAPAAPHPQKQQLPAQNAQKPAQNGPAVQNAPKPAPQPQKQPVPAQNAQKPVQVAQKPAQNAPHLQKQQIPAQNSIPQKTVSNGSAQKGALSQAQPAQQEVQAAAGPKWSRTPGKVQTQGPQPEQPKQVTAVAPPQGKTALRQTAQVQEQELANETARVMSPILARKPQIQADHLAQKFVEKPEEQKEKLAVQKGQQLEGAKRWVADSEIREQEMQSIERGPKAVILQNMLAHQQAPYLNTTDFNRKTLKPMDDACWQTQRRVPVEIQQPQVGKIQIPELNEKEVQRTIVAQPASYQKVQWNEFPEEQKVELSAAPKTKTQDWIPVNNEQLELQRSIYKPARMSAIWPPPQDELVKEGHSPLVVKANDDTAWIQQDQNGVLKQAVWGKTSRINRVWPPPENESDLSDFGPQHMPVVQWPPPESEAHEREQVEVLQKHIPTKKMERQWPPPPPQYQVVESSGEIETRYNPAEVEHQQAVNSLRMGHIHV